MVEGFPVKVAWRMIPITPTRKHQNLRPGFCRISRICLHLDNIVIIRDWMWPSSAHVWCPWLSWYCHHEMRYDHKWKCHDGVSGVKETCYQIAMAKTSPCSVTVVFPFTFLCPIFVSSFFFLSSCRSIALGNLSCKCYLHPHLPKGFHFSSCTHSRRFMPSTTTSWFRNAIFKVRNINLQLTNGEPITTLLQPYVRWCSWIPYL